jgi:hypothetical protein
MKYNKKSLLEKVESNDDSEYDIGGSAFVEKDFYIDPPELDPGATEEEIKNAWSEWDKENRKLRANHKRKWTKAQEAGELPTFLAETTTIKVNGVWKQRDGAVGLEGDVDSGVDLVVSSRATQDLHFQQRGKRANRKGNRHKSSRNNERKKELKRQMILNSKGRKDE